MWPWGHSRPLDSQTSAPRSSSTSSFWVRAPRTLGWGPEQAVQPPESQKMVQLPSLNLITPTGHGGAW